MDIISKAETFCCFLQLHNKCPSRDWCSQSALNDNMQILMMHKNLTKGNERHETDILEVLTQNFSHDPFNSLSRDWNRKIPVQALYFKRLPPFKVYYILLFHSWGYKICLRNTFSFVSIIKHFLILFWGERACVKLPMKACSDNKYKNVERRWNKM